MVQSGWWCSGGGRSEESRGAQGEEHSSLGQVPRCRPLEEQEASQERVRREA
jgi:hypothetical protein